MAHCYNLLKVAHEGKIPSGYGHYAPYVILVVLTKAT